MSPKSVSDEPESFPRSWVEQFVIHILPIPRQGLVSLSIRPQQLERLYSSRPLRSGKHFPKPWVSPMPDRHDGFCGRLARLAWVGCDRHLQEPPVDSRLVTASGSIGSSIHAPCLFLGGALL